MTEPARFAGRRVLVVGDLMTDVDIHGDCTRFDAAAAGCPVFLETRKESRPGGAGAVAEMVRGLGAAAELVAGEASVRARHLAGGRQVWRIDTDAPAPTPDEVVRLRVAVEEAVRRAAVVLVADYGRGVCSPTVVRTAIQMATARGLPVLVDPARGSSWLEYRGATLIKCNRAEWEAAYELHRGESAGWWEAIAGGVVVTGGPRGMTHYPRRERAVDYPTDPVEAVDVTGAGDMVLACLGVCAAAGLAWPEAIRFANRMAGLKVARHGAVPVAAP